MLVTQSKTIWPTDKFIDAHSLTANVYYLKRVFRTPFLDAVKARYSSGEWHSRPGREWDALRRLQEIGVAAPEPVACAEEYRNGLVRRAYIILKEAPVSGSLESHFLSDSCEFDHQSIKLLIAQALISLKRMHDHGVNHRDFYLGHLFLSHRNEVWVLDLDRADVRDEMPIRWRIKDLAALHFSIPERLLSTRERLSILRHNYLENSLSSERRLLEAIVKKAQTIRKHVERKVARRAPNFHVND